MPARSTPPASPIAPGVINYGQSAPRRSPGKTQTTRLSMPSVTRHLPFETGPFVGSRHVFYSSASKPNEPTFLAGDSIMALFITPCQCTTYVNPRLRKGPFGEKAYFQTNLTLGGIGNMGRPFPGPSAERPRALRKAIPIPLSGTAGLDLARRS